MGHELQLVTHFSSTTYASECPHFAYRVRNSSYSGRWILWLLLRPPNSDLKRFEPLLGVDYNLIHVVGACDRDCTLE
jgi:hypothetical protein